MGSMGGRTTAGDTLVVDASPTAIRDRSPLWFEVARRLPAKRWAVRDALARRGWLEDAAPVRFGDRVALMPLDEYQCWKHADLAEIDRESTDALAAELKARFDRWTMLDCGANAGLFTLAMATKAPGLERVEAFEPNPAYAGVLRANLDSLGIAATAHQAAVSDAAGRGRLESPAGDDGRHAMFLRMDPDGPIAVARLDDLDVPAGSNLVVKLDVEGAEPVALAGARRLLGSAAGFVLFVEFHADVLARTGQDARELFDMVDAIRPTRWVDAERPSQDIDKGKPVLGQTVNHRICDLIGLPEDGR